MAKFLFRWGIKHPVIKHTGSSQLGTLNNTIIRFQYLSKITNWMGTGMGMGWKWGLEQEWGWDGMQLDRI